MIWLSHLVTHDNLRSVLEISSTESCTQVHPRLASDGYNHRFIDGCSTLSPFVWLLSVTGHARLSYRSDGQLQLQPEGSPVDASSNCDFGRVAAQQCVEHSAANMHD